MTRGWRASVQAKVYPRAEQAEKLLVNAGFSGVSPEFSTRDCHIFAVVHESGTVSFSTSDTDDFDVALEQLELIGVKRTLALVKALALADMTSAVDALTSRIATLRAYNFEDVT